MMNFNVVTVFTPAQRARMKEMFQHNRRVETMMNRVEEQVKRQNYRSTYNAKLVVRQYKPGMRPVASDNKDPVPDPDLDPDPPSAQTETPTPKPVPRPTLASGENEAQGACTD